MNIQVNTASNPIDISVVIPVYNEEESVTPLVKKVSEALLDFGRTFEIIVVDDGSTDSTVKVLKGLKSRHPELKIIVFRRNFGQSAAMTAGFDLAQGKVVVSMDGDLQNDPKDIPKLIAKLEEGYDLVSGWRKDRQDRFLDRRLPSIIANAIIGRSTGVKLHDYGCSLKAYTNEVAKNLLLYGELHRFIPVLAYFYGARIAEMEVTHHARIYGKSKYNISRTIRVILDLILMLFFRKFATRPLQFFGLSGLALSGIGFLIELYLLWVKFVLGEDIGTRPLLLFGAVLIIAGLILFSIGLVAELVIRTYYEASGRRIYTIREVL